MDNIIESLLNKGATYDVFRENEDIKSVTLTKGVIRIEEAAFHKCTNLTSVYIPSSVTFIGKHAFSQSGLEIAESEDINNWKVLQVSQANRYEYLDLSNPSINAQYLNSNGYYYLDWIKE